MFKILMCLICFTFVISNYANNLKLIKFHQEGEISKLNFEFDNDKIKAKRFHVKQDKQIIIDLFGVESTERVLRPFDTSEFSGAVIFVSPYKRKDKNEKNIRIAIQLRDNVRSILDKQGNNLILSIENRFGAFNQKQVNRARENEKQIVEESVNSKELKNEIKNEELNIIHSPKSDSIEDILDNLVLSGPKKYVGKKISFNVKDIAVEDLLKMVADSSGFNIILDQDVKKPQPLTLSITNIPWDQALDTILNISKLVAKKNGSILTITTLAKATEEKRLEDLAKQIDKKVEPLVTRIFPISFADTTDLVKMLEKYLTPERGNISVDKRTNYLIVKDTIDVIERIKKIIETLDTQTPQILIESKIVEANESFSKELGLKNTSGSGISLGYDPITSALSSSNFVGPGFSFNSAPSAASNLFGFTIKSFKRLTGLDFQLQLMENESKGKIISSPKVITENNKKAVISSTKTTSYLVPTVTSTSTNAIPTFQTIDATIKLDVTPKVTNDGSIAMEVVLDKGSFAGTRSSQFAPPDKTTHSINTNVLVDNGSTVVIGGIYLFDTNESHSGIPFLKDIPIVGWLFRTAYNPVTNKAELIIFLTPRVINQKEAGLEASNTEVAKL